MTQTGIRLFTFVIFMVAVPAFLYAGPGNINPLEDAVNAYEFGNYSLAARRAEDLCNLAKDPKWRARAEFLVGRALASSGEFNRAEASFGAAVKVIPSLKPYALYKLGICYYEAGDNEKAAALFEEMAGSAPRSPLLDDALLGEGRALHALLQYKKAAGILERLINLSPPVEMKVEALYLLMHSYYMQGDNDKANGRFMTLWREYPASSYMDKAEAVRKTMVDAGYRPPAPTSDDIIMRADAFERSGWYNSAAKEYKLAASMLDETDSRLPGLMLKAGRAYYKARANKSAVLIFKNIANDYPGSDEAPSALYWLARTYLRTGPEAELVAALKRLETQYPDHPNTALMEYYYASELVFDGEYDKAAGMLEAASDGRSSEVAEDALWKLGWARYLKAEYPQAVETFTKFMESYPRSSLAPAALYWHARSLERLGDTDAAEGLKNRLGSEYRLSFYGHISGVPGRVYRMGGSGLRPDAFGAPAYMDSYADPELQLAAELGLQGMYSDAMAVMKGADMRYGGSPEGLVTLAGLYSQLGEYRRPLELATGLYRSRMDSGSSPIPVDAMRIIFPAGFRDVVQKEARDYDIDPFLVASLIREESHYDPRAVSPAGALGLMQLMPKTAAMVCRKLDMSPPRESDLKDGSYNVPLGVCYLAELLKRHDGRVVYALCEYNAGPVALGRWQKRMPNAPDDEFIENIGYRETRNYVKRVLRNYYIYRELYGE